MKAARSSTSKLAKSRKAPDVTTLEAKIRRRAYELYLERGGADGSALEDWLRAEAEVTRGKARSIAA